MKTQASGTFARIFINSKLTPLLMVVFVMIGIYSAYLTPREEEPQIDVPIADLLFSYPGASPQDVELHVIRPVEKLVSNVKGVEYVYSQSMPGQGMMIVQFYVGEDIERSLVKLYNEIIKHMDQMPRGVQMPLVKTRSIDDVPVLGLTLWSDRYDDFELKRVAQELDGEIKQIFDVSHTNLIGGRNREIQVLLDRDKMKAFSIDPLMVAQQIQASGQQLQSGFFNRDNEQFSVQTGRFLTSVDDVKSLVVGVFQQLPIYLHQIATVVDGPEEPVSYVSFGYGSGSGDLQSRHSGDYPAVTISVAKRRGADAMRLTSQIMAKVDSLKSDLLTADIHVSTTRNYGETAADKVTELLTHLMGAVLAVSLVVLLAMGWRGALVVFISVPITFALTMFSYYFLDYTLNRITLFALVFVTGIVVDDSIIIAENMHRHFKMKKMPPLQAALYAIDEVGNPTILATLTVIAAVIPMVFVGGMMGPYMSPMPIGAALAMIFSLIVALMITPWLAYRFLRHRDEHHDDTATYQIENSWIYKAYYRLLTPLLESSMKRWVFISGIVVLLLISVSLFLFKVVTVKILPFDNKSELQLVIDMPEGTTLESTAVVAKEIALYLTQNELVDNYQTYVGTSAPISFNGLVRHYDLRRGANVADIQVNLIHKSDRSLSSHDIAKLLRDPVQQIGRKYGANVKVVEVPPGPPVMSTIVAEIYGPDYQKQLEVAQQVKDRLSLMPNVVDVDWMMEDVQTEFLFDVDKERAMLAGVSPHQVVAVMNMALSGQNVTPLFAPNEKNQTGVVLRLPEFQRSSVDDLRQLTVISHRGTPVSISDLVTVREQTKERSIYRKNQKRVVFVTAEVAGELESPVYAILDFQKEMESIQLPEGYALTEHYTGQPFVDQDYGLKWDGEWQITYEVFRDLGAAFAVVLVIIYLLIVGWFQNLKTPIVMMIAIPLSLIGIILGHWLLGAFFSATSMIGMIALAGVMVRNSILLIDFINLRLAAGVELKVAIIEAGSVRTMPIVLTALTVVIGAVVILFDPIFQGLAISLMGGTVASTLLTLIIVPVIYYMVERKKHDAKDSLNSEE